MRTRWRLILPCLGWLLFALGSYESFRNDRLVHKQPSRYFWWSSIRLDSAPLEKHSRITPCKEVEVDCVGWDPSSIWVDPGLLAETLILSALPAFAVGALIVGCLGRFGISQVSTFMVTMPTLIGAWYYLVGWSFD